MARSSAVVATICCSAVLLLWAPGTLASPPNDLSNFQNAYACDRVVNLVRPQTLEDVAEAVRIHQHVRAMGEGHSWNQPFFCAASTMPPTPAAAADTAVPTPGSAPPSATKGRRLLSDAPADNTNSTAVAKSANIALTTLRPLHINVSKSESAVWVDAGVKTIDLLQFLANYVTPTAPAGYTLGAFPWFVYQTIGGAVATGTHGSNLGPHKSLSNQVLALDVILANGTRRVFSNDTDPFLMRALRVSVGKLGIIVRVKLHIVPEVPVRRSLKALTTPQFLELLTSAQEVIKGGGSPPAWMNETQIFWLPQTQQFMLVGFSRSDTEGQGALENVLAGFTPDNTTVFGKNGALLTLGELVLPADAALQINNSQVLLAPPAPGAPGNSLDTEPYAAAQRWLDGFMASTVNAPLAASVDNNSNGSSHADAARTVGVSWQVPKPKPPAAAYVVPNAATSMMAISAAGINFVAGNLSSEPNRIYIKQPVTSLPTIRGVAYDQYEVSIPLTTMADCWRKVLEVVHEGDLAGTNATQRAIDKGLRTAALIRLVGQEDGLLSHTHDGPRMYINLEDYIFWNSNQTVNQPFRKIIGLLTGDPACTAQGPPRLHWGKAGWPDKGCFHGDKVYGDNWCHFGCAVQQLDPTSKFQDSAADRWTWAGVDLQRCCGESGFKVGTPGCECRVQHERNMSDCPPAPFYTAR